MESDVIRYLVISGRVECKMLPSCAEKHKKPAWALSVMEERVVISVVYANPTNVQVVQGRIDRYQIHPYELVRRITEYMKTLQN